MEVPRLPQVADYLFWYADLLPDTPAMSDAEGELTYRELAQRVRVLVGSMVAAGVERGDRIAVYGNPCIDCASLLYAAASIGAIYVGLNPKYSARELTVILDDAEPRLLVMLHTGDEHHLEKVQAAIRASCVQPHVVSRHGASSCNGLHWDTWLSRRVRDDDLTREREKVRPEDPVAMVYTSGSTGTPKGALLLNRGLVRSYTIQARRWYETRPITVSDLPVNHLGWVGDHCCAMLVAGGTLHFLERYSPEAVLALIEKRRATYWFTITSMLLLAVQHPRWSRTDLRSLERIAWGGAAAPRHLVEKLSGVGVKLATCYGMTETSGNVTYTDDEASLDILYETVGRPDGDLEVGLLGEDGRACTTGETGEIVVRGDVVFGGYFRRPSETAEAIDRNGWLHTGDLALQREDGNLVLAGRRHDMFKSGGYNVYPREVELALERHPCVAQAVVVSVEDETWGEVGHAFVRPQVGATLHEDELREWAREHLANYKIPKSITVPAELPLLPIGKVDKHALRQEARTRAPTSPPTV